MIKNEKRKKEKKKERERKKMHLRPEKQHKFCGSCILFENPPIFANIHFNIVNKNRICRDNATSMLKLMYRIAFLQPTFLLKAPLNPNVKMYLHKAPINSAVYFVN